MPLAAQFVRIVANLRIAVNHGQRTWERGHCFASETLIDRVIMFRPFERGQMQGLPQKDEELRPKRLADGFLNPPGDEPSAPAL